MEVKTQTNAHTMTLNLTSQDIFVLVLIPESFNANAIGIGPDTLVCGQSIEKWVEGAVSAFNYRKVDVRRTDDIMTLVKRYTPENGHKYTVVVYVDTPLITKQTIDQAIIFARNHSVVRLPRGWVFDTSYIKNNDEIYPVDAMGLSNQDFTIAHNLAQVNLISSVLRGRIVAHHIANGVYIESGSCVSIDAGAKISSGVFIESNVQIAGSTIIGPNAKILANSRLESAQIGQNTTINASQITGSSVGSNCTVGPWANIRVGCRIGQRCRIGNFVEIKNSTIGEDTKIAHMTYVGDAEIGKECNLGAGVVFCNYDGVEKHKVTIGNKVFVGANVNFIAPVTVEDEARIAAGSTITNNVEKGSLAIARARQEVKAVRSKPESKSTSETRSSGVLPPVVEEKPKPTPKPAPVIKPEPIIEEDEDDEVEELVIPASIRNARKPIKQVEVQEEDEIEEDEIEKETEQEPTPEPDQDDGEDEEESEELAEEEAECEEKPEQKNSPLSQGEYPEGGRGVVHDESSDDDEDAEDTDEDSDEDNDESEEESEEDDSDEEEESDEEDAEEEDNSDDEDDEDHSGEEDELPPMDDVPLACDDDFDGPNHMPYEGNRALYERANRQFSFFSDEKDN